jgi:hypothetical protein
VLPFTPADTLVEGASVFARGDLRRLEGPRLLLAKDDRASSVGFSPGSGNGKIIQLPAHGDLGHIIESLYHASSTPTPPGAMSNTPRASGKNGLLPATDRSP